MTFHFITFRGGSIVRIGINRLRAWIKSAFQSDIRPSGVSKHFTLEIIETILMAFLQRWYIEYSPQVRCQSGIVCSTPTFTMKIKSSIMNKGNITMEKFRHNNTNVKFSKDLGALMNHKNEGIKKSMGRIKKHTVSYVA